MYRRKKTVPYRKRSRRERKEAYIWVKNRIRESEPILGAPFFTDDYIYGENAWVDVYFMSRRRPRMFYNATLSTLKYMYTDSLLLKAFDAVDELIPEEYSSMHMRVVDNRLMFPDYEMVDGKEVPIKFPALGGKTKMDWIYEEQRRLVDTREHPVYEEVELDYSYATGIGLHAQIDADGIGVDDVIRFMERFYVNGERGWVSEEPVTYGSHEMNLGQVNANMLLAPKDWPKNSDATEVEEGEP